jgi:hypothetical protein
MRDRGVGIRATTEAECGRHDREDKEQGCAVVHKEPGAKHMPQRTASFPDREKPSRH